jgi:hypothetical protein
MLTDNKLPGFLHKSALTVSTRNKIQLDAKIVIEYEAMTPPVMHSMIKNSPYLYLPYDKPHSYIMNSSNGVFGLIFRRENHTYWFKDPISLGELHIAQTREIPILCEYSNIGVSSRCEVCEGYGAVDWVDSALLGKEYHKPPDDRYIWATHKYLNFLIDNKWILDYDGFNILHPCPKCLGLGVKEVLTVQGEEITAVKFEEHMYELLMRGSYNSLDFPYYQFR